MSILAVISVIGSTVLVLGIVLNGLVGPTVTTHYIILLGSILDVLCDVICIALSLSINDTQYSSWCRVCDGVLRRCCIKLTDRTTRKKEMELARALELEQKEAQPPSGSTSNSTVLSVSANTASSAAETVPGNTVRPEPTRTVVRSDAHTTNTAIIH